MTFNMLRLATGFHVVLVSLISISPVRGGETVFPKTSWTTRKPDDVGLNAEKLNAFTKAIGGDGVVVRNGYLVKAWGRADRRADWASSCKPVISTLLLFAVHEKTLKSVNDPVRPWLQKRWPEKDLIEKDRSMTFRHLADMTSGYSRAEKPGTHWAYNDYAIKLYAHLMTEVLEASLNDAALARLKPLDLQDGDLFGSRGGAGVNTSPRDFARIGWWWLNRGNWNGKQLLPRKMLINYCQPDVPRKLPRTKKPGRDYLKVGTHGGGTNQNFSGQGVYGLNWWFNAKMPNGEFLLPHLPKDAYCTIGHVGKEVMLIVPSWKLVVAARGNWGGVRLTKTKLLTDAIVSKD